MLPSLLNNKIKQVASARFGVTAEYLVHAEEIEIKIAQGAKPGEGGQLPGHKVTELIARLRHAQPGMQLISPPPHHDIYSIEDLAQLIYDLKRVNPRAAVGVKLVSEMRRRHCRRGRRQGLRRLHRHRRPYRRHRRSPLSSIKYAGNPWELGLAEAQQVLIHNGLRGRVRLRTDGGLRTARDIVIAALLGADEFAFGTAVLVALGCDMARQCHLNTCPTGIATQKPELRAKFRGKPEHVVRFFEELPREVRQLLAKLGLPSLAAATGRTDLLEQVRFDGGLDLNPVLAATAVAVATGNPIRWEGQAQRPSRITPTHRRCMGRARARCVQIQGSLTPRCPRHQRRPHLGRAPRGPDRSLPHRQSERIRFSLTFDLKGVAGQSFGALQYHGMTLNLEGLANDFVGKGLCGGELILRGQGRAALQSADHTSCSATSRSTAPPADHSLLPAAPASASPFATPEHCAIVEGVGDHGCEYMTGGLAVILGGTGINFGAGMTGGLAWVYDEDGDFLRDGRFHSAFLHPDNWDQLDDASRESIRELVALHAAKTASTRARWLLANWQSQAPKFVRLTPKPQS